MRRARVVCDNGLCQILRNDGEGTMKTVKTLGCAGVLLCATLDIGSLSAMAADITEAAPSWTGPYIGANIGYGWDEGDADIKFKPTGDQGLDAFLQEMIDIGLYPTSFSPDGEGISGGGQLGYNWQLPSDWVVGIEADLQTLDIDKSESVTEERPFFEGQRTGVGKEIDWFGTLRARAGYLINPQWLLYATGGIAYGETRLSYNTVNTFAGCVPLTLCVDDASSGVKLGWTIGAGAEVMLAPNWSVKAEYLYVDLGRRSFDARSPTAEPVVVNVSADYREQIVRVGLNYHFN